MTTGPSADRRRPSGLSSRPREDERPRRAFTLLELIIVLALVGLLLALAAPSLRGFVASRETAQAAGQVLAMTQFAGSRAVAQGTVYRLNIDPAAHCYWLCAQQGSEFVDLDCQLGQRFSFPDGMTVRLVLPSTSPRQSYIQFFPNGRTEAASIELIGRRGDVFRIVCDSATEAYRVVTPSETSL